MDGDNKKNSVELEASLAPAEAEVGAVAKADQYQDESQPIFANPEAKPKQLIKPVLRNMLTGNVVLVKLDHNI